MERSAAAEDVNALCSTQAPFVGLSFILSRSHENVQKVLTHAHFLQWVAPRLLCLELHVLDGDWLECTS
ncbi:hypothetical protein WJX72_002506 [[Myrmecia] bisecta]|uniref:Uncharacterized protein n=1 Tax=[Myrmecia] bisecta TaxID=41462 RepID=A0AAW1PL70_9CHLO